MRGQNNSIDLLKFFSSIAVVGIHSNLFADINTDIQNFITNGIFRLAVPIFFILSGFLFNEKNVKKQSIRLLRMCFIWSVIYYYSFSLPLSLNTIVKSLFVGIHHLWYINALIICYWCYNRFITDLKKNEQILLALCLFLIGALLQYSRMYEVHVIFDRTYIYRNFLFVGIPFFILGKILATDEKFINKVLKILNISLVLSILEFGTKKSIGLDIPINSIILAPIIVFKFLNLNVKISKKYLDFGQTSVVIYLAHPLLILVIQKITNSTIEIFMFTTTLLILFCLISHRFKNDIESNKYLFFNKIKLFLKS